MKEEFNLSEKWDNECGTAEGWNVYHEEDVKEFIKRLKEGIELSPPQFAVLARDYGEEYTKGFRNAIIGFFGIIDKLAGDKLI